MLAHSIEGEKVRRGQIDQRIASCPSEAHHNVKTMEVFVTAARTECVLKTPEADEFCHHARTLEHLLPLESSQSQDAGNTFSRHARKRKFMNKFFLRREEVVHTGSVRGKDSSRHYFKRADSIYSSSPSKISQVFDLLLRGIHRRKYYEVHAFISNLESKSNLVL
ncbi:hypothetical protein Mp_2g21280 [Marchantia polymorpha subsp. ruderalis]|uniref:Uncharacterized protein n=1 Tax=Marchantia polymorpha TaxID=3197 RepID=A0A2R6X2T2_MARPO|nr:hypothetical protein MARPO_0040s0086 [Marchantia polymorpha]BBN03163.1 hypothetical protein Mp_2g21280 [Marchantia polymorpha subsp. ruderalis]|eukprot:PTQ40414.1 hypothetical protein MARPO_0040s0086 [Marchantia polymorpha]